MSSASSTTENTRKPRTTFITALYALTETYLRVGKRQDALHLLNANRDFLEGDTREHAEFLLNYGRVLTADAMSTNRTLDQVNSLLLQAKSLAEQSADEYLLADILDALGEVYYVKGHKVSAEEGDYEKGLVYFQQALALREKLHDEYGLSRSSLNVGRMQQNLEQLEAARAAIERAYERAIRQQRVDVQAEALQHLASLNTDSDAALQQVAEVIALREQAGLRGVLVHSYLMRAELYHAQGNLTKAREYYQQCMSVAEETAQPQSTVSSLLGLGYIHLDSGEKQEARAYFEQALALAQSIGLKTGIQEAAEALQA
jgi:tetratricopeptide (TPR) repeat protein